MTTGQVKMKALKKDIYALAVELLEGAMTNHRNLEIEAGTEANEPFEKTRVRILETQEKWVHDFAEQVGVNKSDVWKAVNDLRDTKKDAKKRRLLL